MEVKLNMNTMALKEKEPEIICYTECSDKSKTIISQYKAMSLISPGIFLTMT